MKYNRPRKYNPVISYDVIAESERGARILAERNAKGHKNPQAWLHGKVKLYTPDEVAQFVANHPQYGPLSASTAALLQGNQGEDD